MWSQIRFDGILPLVAFFTCRRLGSLCFVLDRWMRFSRLSNNNISCLGFPFSPTIVAWVFGYWWCFLLERLLHGLSMCLWPSYCFLTLIYWLPTTARFGSFLADFGYKRFFYPPPPPMLCFFIGDGVPLLGVIFESSYLALFCGKFGRLVMLLGSIYNLSLLMRLCIRWYQILGLLVSLLPLSLPS